MAQKIDFVWVLWKLLGGNFLPKNEIYSCIWHHAFFIFSHSGSHKYSLPSSQSCIQYNHFYWHITFKYNVQLFLAEYWIMPEKIQNSTKYIYIVRLEIVQNWIPSLNKRLLLLLLPTMPVNSEPKIIFWWITSKLDANLIHSFNIHVPTRPTGFAHIFYPPFVSSSIEFFSTFIQSEMWMNISTILTFWTIV